MAVKIISTLITVLLGVGAALPSTGCSTRSPSCCRASGRQRLKPFLYILPAYVAIIFYLIYPAIQTLIYSFKDASSDRAGSGSRTTPSCCRATASSDTLFNTLLWMIVVPAVTVVLGLVVAVLADRLTRGREALARRIIFLPMAISWSAPRRCGASSTTSRPAGQPQIGLHNAFVGVFGGDPIAWLEQSQFHFNSLLLMVDAALGAGRLLDGAAVRGRQGRARRHPRGRPHRRRQRAADLLPGRRAADQGHDHHRLRHRR